MFLGQVIGTVVSPVQAEDLDGRKQLLVRPVTPDGAPAGRVRIAVDLAGAGEGDRVLVIDEGNSGRQLLEQPVGSIKTLVVGVVDYVELAGELAYDHRD
jgi:microcompartment protein CcmK/EutM